MLQGFVIEVEQGKIGPIAYIILDQEILDFSGRSATKVEDSSTPPLACHPAGLFGE